MGVHRVLSIAIVMFDRGLILVLLEIECMRRVGLLGSRADSYGQNH